MSSQQTISEEKKQLRVFFENSSWTFIGNILRVVLLMVKSVIVARGLGVELYGVCSVVFATTGILQELFNLNIGTTVVKFGAIYKANNENNKLFALLKISIYSIFLTTLFSVGSLVVIKWLKPDLILKGLEMKAIYVLFAIASCSNLFDYLLISLLRVYDNYKQVAFLNFVATFFEVALIAICFLYFGPSVEAFFIILILARILKTSLLFRLAQRKLNDFFIQLKSGVIPDIKGDYKPIGWFTLNNSLSRKVQSLISKGDVLLLEYFTGFYEVGLYTLAKKLAGYVMVPIDPMIQSIFPQFSNLIAKQNYAEVRFILRRMTGLISIGGIIAIGFLYLFPDLYKIVVGWVFSKDYTQSWEGFSVLFVNGVITAIFFWHLSLIQSLGLVKLRLLVNTIAVAIGLAVGWVLIPQFKSTGTAISLTISNSFIVIALAIISYRHVVKKVKELA